MKLPWDSKNNINTAFPIHYSKHFLTEFAQGNHSVTKAFVDHLGLADDYDFCWGPAEEGEPLPPGQAEYTERLWGVYAKTAGEIYLLKSNADLSGWEREELLTYVPSGSRYPSIVFNPLGYYEVAVEFTPAGLEIPEIWILSHPYAGEKIRKICIGTRPRLFFEHNRDVLVFYTNQEQLNVYYRLMSENFATEYSVDSIFIPERKLNLKKIYTVYEQMNDSELSAIIKEIIFYTREDDIRPLKYAMYKVVNPAEEHKLEIAINSLSWEDVSYLINFSAYNQSTGLGVSGATVTIHAQRVQEEVIVVTNAQGKSSFKLIPYDTVYYVTLEHPELGMENSFGILVDGVPIKEMDISIPFLAGANKPQENSVISSALTGIVFEMATYDVNLTVYDNAGNILPNATVTVHAQRDQVEVVKVTDAQGKATLKVLPYDTIYDVTLEHSSFGVESSIGVLFYGHDDTWQMDIILYFFDQPVEEASISNVSVLSTAWEDVTYELNIYLFDQNSNPIANADITLFGQVFQDSITVTTNGVGYAYVADIIPYPTLYEVLIEHLSYPSETAWILVDNDPDKSMTINLYMLEGRNSRLSETSFSSVLESILWVEVV